jgi:hypothetical protein
VDEVHSQNPTAVQPLKAWFQKATGLRIVPARLDLLVSALQQDLSALRHEVDALSTRFEVFFTWFEGMKPTVLDALTARDHEVRLTKLEQWQHQVWTAETTRLGLSLTARNNRLALVAVVVALVGIGCSALLGLLTLLDRLGLVPFPKVFP